MNPSRNAIAAFSTPAARANADMAAVPNSAIQSTYKFRVTGQTVQPTEQATFFNIVSDPAMTATTAVLTPVSNTGFTLAEIASFMQINPAPPVNLNVPYSNNAAIPSSMKLFVVRKQPDGAQASRFIDLSAYQTPGDFVATRVQADLPGDVIFDGYSFARIVNDSQATAGVYDAVFSFARRHDQRSDVEAGTPVIIGRNS